MGEGLHDCTPHIYSTSRPFGAALPAPCTVNMSLFPVKYHICKSVFIHVPAHNKIKIYKIFDFSKTAALFQKITKTGIARRYYLSSATDICLSGIYRFRVKRARMVKWQLIIIYIEKMMAKVSLKFADKEHTFKITHSGIL